MNLGNVIRRLRKAKGWTLHKMCEEIHGGIQPGHLSRIERNELLPNVLIARNIARALGTTIDLILSESEGGHLAKIQDDPIQRVPVLSWVQAGNWTDAEKAVLPEMCDKWIVAPRANLPPRCYALEVRGDSMQSPYKASFPEGCFILVDPNKQADNMSYVVAMTADTEQATFKQLVTDGAEKYLKPLNPQYPLIKIEQEIIICGVVFDMVCHVDQGF